MTRKRFEYSLHPAMEDLFGYVTTLYYLSLVLLVVLICSVIGIIFIWIPIIVLQIRRTWSIQEVRVVHVLTSINE